MYTSAGMSIAKRDTDGLHAGETDAVLKSATVWLDQLMVSITYPKHSHQSIKGGESVERSNAFHVAIDTINLNATVKTPMGAQQQGGRREISALCEIGWAEAEIDSTRSALLKVFKEEWDPNAKKYNFVNRRMYYAGESQAEITGMASGADQFSMIHEHERTHEDMGDTSDSSIDSDLDGSDQHNIMEEDELAADAESSWSSPEAAVDRTTIVFGVAKLGSLGVRANLGKVLGQLTLDINEAVIRGTKIDRLPNMMSIGLTIKDIAVQDGHADQTENKKREARGIVRGSVVASDITSGISWAYPPGTLRIGPEEESREVCIIHVRAGVGALDAKLSYLATLILITRLVKANLKVDSKWHTSQLTPDVWRHKCELDVNWHSFDCAVTKDTVPLLLKIVKRFRLAIVQQTDELLGKPDELEGSTIASTVTAGPVVPVPGAITISGKHACITLFKNNFSESEWLFIDLDEFKLVFTQFDPGGFPFTQMQTVCFTAGLDGDGKGVHAVGTDGKTVVPFIIAHRKWKRGIGSRPSTADDARLWCTALRSKSTTSPIFSIPPMSMNTSSFKLGHRVNPKVLSRFATNFDGGFGVTTDANYLIALNSLIDAYKRKLVSGQTATESRAYRTPHGHGETIAAPSSSSSDDSDDNEGDDNGEHSQTISSSPPPSTIATAVEPDPIKFITLPQVLHGDAAPPGFHFIAFDGREVSLDEDFPVELQHWKELMAHDGERFAGLDMQLLAAVVAASTKFQEGFVSHTDENCDFTFDPEITPISVGNIAPPSVDYIMAKVFNIKDPHGTFNRNIYSGLNTAMSGIINNLDGFPRPLFAPPKVSANASQVL
jgi:hypothetical protein